MKAKTRKILLYILICLMVVTLFTASLTLGRYSSEQKSEGLYDSDIEFILSTQVTVRSIDEFFAAIANGYSNIKLDDGVDNPLIVSGDSGVVGNDLVIDLNGHEIQRNNREPLLTVGKDVSLTIIDSSAGKTGSLYNPVGSVLKVTDGGSISIQDGILESGPRSGKRNADGSRRDSDGADYNEYATASGNNWTTGDGGSISGATGTNGTVFVRIFSKPDSDSGEITYKESTTDYSMPVILPAVESGAVNRTVNGNMYFDENLSEQDINYSGIIVPDTYVYFTIEGDPTVQSISTAAEGSADYYYSYPVKWENGACVYAGGETIDNENVFEAKVYIYNDVKGSVGDSISSGTTQTTYAAIDMTGGQVALNGGYCHAYFGVAGTSCVTASGGKITVDQGNFSAYGDSTCVECDFLNTTLDENSAAPFTVTDGDFYSEIGDTVVVSHGDMEIGNGNFIKNSTSSPYKYDPETSTPGTGTETEENPHGANGSVINIVGGNLTITHNATISLIGSYMNGIHSSGTSGNSDNSEITVSNATILVNSVIKENADGVIFDHYTYNRNGYEDFSFNYGIYSESGTITCDATTKIAVSGTYSAGIYSSGGEINIGGDKFYCFVSMDENSTELSSTAVSSTGTNSGIIFNVAKAQITSNALGLSVGGGSVSFGSVTTGDDGTVTTTSISKISLTTTRGTGIYVYGGALTVNAQYTLEVTSKIDGDVEKWASDTSSGSGATDTGINIYNGIYVQSGSLISNGTLNVTHTGLPNDDVGDGQNEDITDKDNGALSHENDNHITHNYYNTDDTYYTFKIKSHAIRVEAEAGSDSTVTITKGNIVNKVEGEGENQVGGGGGLYVSGGTVNLGNSNNPLGNDLSITATGNQVYSDFYWADSSNQWDNWSFKVPESGGHAVQVVGGTLEVYSGTYTSAQGNGILINSGTARIYSGQFTGADQYYSMNDKDIAGAAASYGLKVCGGTAVVYGGTFGVSSGNSSGAFLMGQNNTDKTYIYGGTFNAPGQAGISLYQYANVEFDEGGTDDYGKGETITVSGVSAGMTIEKTSSRDNAPEVSINGGTFTASNGNGIWYGNGNAVLNIEDGTFTGTGGSGLYIESESWDIELSGGTYTGNSGINGYYPNRISTGDIIAQNRWCYSSGVEFSEATAICNRDWRMGWFEIIYTYKQIGYSNSVLLDDTVYVNENGSDFNELDTIVISDRQQADFER